MDQEAELDIYYSIAIAMGLIFVFAVAVIAFFLRYRQGLYKQQLILEQKESEHRLELLKATVEITELERKRIAEELHDAIGSHLAVAKMVLNQINVNAGNPSDLQKIVDESKQTINDTIHTVRAISHDLYPPELSQFGFNTTITDLFEKLSKTDHIQFYLDPNYTFKTDENNLQLALYRVTQELVTNTLKYSEASVVSLKLTPQKDQLYVAYTDNGKGTDLSQQSTAKGLGMLTIESRLKALNAMFEFKSAPGEGFEIHIKIPLHE